MAWTTAEYFTAVSTAVSVVALMRPELSRVFRRWTNDIDLHPAGRIEIGFSGFGPTIGIEGTLRAVRNDQFITSMNLTVIRSADHLQHSFEWAIFRRPVLFQAQPNDMQIAAGFFLPTNEARRFSIQFHDRSTADRYRDPVMALRNQWMNFVQANNLVLPGQPSPVIRGHYGTFATQHSQHTTPAFAAVNNEFYWQPGRYDMRIDVSTSRPSKRFSFSYTFELTAADSQLLRLNAIAIMMTACDVPDVIFNFAYPQYG
ncbi:MAG: hypothetical protein ACM30I_14285 [Gemmatimonas sp.]